jgi:hypothetical protein
VPLLFAVTLFVSASLLFMVQPMVGKMVLPLLGGSPAVWNACMVFFQALLLLGYLYADRVSTRLEPKKQWTIHLAVLMMAIAALGLAAALSTRHTPIAIAESLSPSERIPPIISVLALLTVAIGIPFFVASTSAPLLQKWFGFTGHPAARDPYFLYAASNAGSLISLLGYPFFIEPYLSLVGQAWVWAVGFAALAGLIAVCGRAAANPVAIPPAGAKVPPNAKGVATPVADIPPVEAPPTTSRKLKWIALAFVPSSLMLGVTFHMTTDIASVPLLWVFPLALYLVTFIIAFGRVPNWFRLVIGNMAPVMILLLVFLMVSDVTVTTGINLMLHILTFFAAALMCHYELARDRPSPQYLTQFFLLMSVGGVLGGLFNSIIAPLVFPLAYEYKLALVVACLLVPNLTDMDDKVAALNDTRRAPSVGSYFRLFGVGFLLGILLCVTIYGTFRLGKSLAGERVPGLVAGASVILVLALLLPAIKIYEHYTKRRVGAVERLAGRVEPWQLSALLDGLAPVLMGALYGVLSLLYYEDQYHSVLNWVRTTFSLPDRLNLAVIIPVAAPVMLCFFFVDRPVRFALSVAAILGVHQFQDQFEQTRYDNDGEKMGTLHTERSFFGILKVEQFRRGWRLERRLVHGTTLHGTQIPKPYLMPHDAPVPFGSLTTWDALLLEGALAKFNPREEPLTYYHRTGPVGAMVHELRRRKGGADRRADMAMVGLGTGSASCYALGPAKPGDPDFNPNGENKPQRLTFYEIDHAVKQLVFDIDTYFTFVKDAQRRGATVDIRMGDARLKLQEDTDRKYALLMVDAFSSDAIPVHLLTREAVQMYMDRLTDDGLLALHISNKYVKLEPVVGAIVNELKKTEPLKDMTALVWNDDGERRPGKTASSWVVLAKDKQTLGGLYSPLGELVARYDSGQLRYVAMAAHPKEYSKIQDILKAEGPKAALVSYLKEKGEAEMKEKGSSDSLLLADLVDKYGPYSSLHDIMLVESGHVFRPVQALEGVDAWTDDYSDVLRVMSISEVQWLRKLAGLPTPIER